ncbi:MAG: spermine synthase [Chloroflexi bacterium]|nr:spermine synthase [Chloroflexota bacterium]
MSLRITLLYIAAFFAGMATLAVEFTTARMLGNIYGTSDIAWSGIIAMMLAYLALGYYIGGRWADRSPYTKTFYTLLAWAAILTALIPFVARPALVGAGVALAQINIPGVVLWILVTIVLFIVPVTLLGCVPPFVMRLAIEDTESSGQVAGVVYGVSTLGSIVGAFTPTLILIPTFGSTRTFLIFAAGIMLIALIGLAVESERRPLLVHSWMPVGLTVLAVIGLQGPLKPAPPATTLLFEQETGYNYVQVVETNGGTRHLLLNEGLAIHSMYNPDFSVIETRGTWDFFMAGPYFNEAPHTMTEDDRLMIIGLAGGTMALQYSAVYGPMPIDGIEIDPALIGVGEDYFGMTLDNLNAIAGDGRIEMRRLNHEYAAIMIDAYRVPYVPWHLLTVEFFEEGRARLADDGVLMMNVGRSPINRELIDAATATLLEVFPSVHVMDVPNTFNSIVVATVQPTEPENLQANIDLLLADEETHPLLIDVLPLAAASLHPTQPNDIIFTDDRAPVEGIVHNLILQFLLESNPAAEIGTFETRDN